MNENDEQEHPQPPDLVQKFPQSYVTCEKHGTTFPRGAKCPDCLREEP
jgi:hypothetical protein